MSENGKNFFGDSECRRKMPFLNPYYLDKPYNVTPSGSNPGAKCDEKGHESVRFRHSKSERMRNKQTAPIGAGIAPGRLVVGRPMCSEHNREHSRFLENADQRTSTDLSTGGES